MTRATENRNSLSLPCESLWVERVFLGLMATRLNSESRDPFAVSQCLCRYRKPVLMGRPKKQKTNPTNRANHGSIAEQELRRGQARFGAMHGVPLQDCPATSCDCRTAKLQPGHGAMIHLTSASRVPARSCRPFSRCFLGKLFHFRVQHWAKAGFSCGDNDALATVEARNVPAARRTCLSLSSQIPEIISSQGFAGGADGCQDANFSKKCIRPMRSRFKVLFSARVFDFDPLIRSRSPCRCRETLGFLKLHPFVVSVSP